MMEESANLASEPLKIRLYSCFLATAYLLFGAAIFQELPQFQTTFTGFNILPFSTRATLAIGSYGWMFLAVMGAGLIVLKDLDLRFQSRFLNPLLTLAFFLWVGFMISVLVLPLYPVSIHSVH